MNKFVQGRPGNTLVEAFVERHLSTLQKTEKEEDVVRLRNCYTFVKMKELLLSKGYHSHHLKLSEPDYYDTPLEARAKFLESPVEYLCKTMVMENTAYNPEFEG